MRLLDSARAHAPRALLLGYRPEQASFRYRMAVLPEALAAVGWEVRCERFPSGRYGLRTWERRELFRWADVSVLHTIKLSPPEATLLRIYARRRVFDLDDAIYVRRPRQPGDEADSSRWRYYKFASTCRAMDAVVVGNAVLAEAARAHARRVLILPTTLDPARYRATTATQEMPPTLVWVGNPENLVYLELVRPALARLAQRLRGLRLRVVSSEFPDWREVEIERVPWSAANEVQALASAHVGIMPLTDDAWARGKCAFKLLQYMAASLPCVASAVGANAEAVLEGVSGYLVRSDTEWEQALERLLADPARRLAFGAAGRAHLQAHYNLGDYIQRYVELLSGLTLPAADAGSSQVRRQLVPPPG